MRRCFVCILLFICAASLSGCDKNISYSYLMRHPDFLQDESLRCSVSEPEVAEDVTYCQLVARAMNDLAAMANIQQLQPEKFGQLVMTTETDLANAEVAMRQAKKAILIAKDNVDKPALELAQSQYAQAKHLHEQKLEELDVLFAILKAHSPE